MTKLSTHALGLLVLVTLTLPAAGQHRRQVIAQPDLARSLAQRVEDEYGTRTFTLPSIELPTTEAARSPDTWAARVMLGSNKVTLLLEPVSLRADDAKVRVWAGDSWTEEELPPSSTYRGWIVGDPGSVVVASLTDAGLRADVVSGAQQGWSIRPLRELDPKATRAGHIAFRDAQPVLPDCGVTEAPVASQSVTGVAGGTFDEIRPGAHCMTRADIAFDADFEYYTAMGSTVQGVIDRIEAHMNQVEFFYARDVRITYQITGYVVRTTPFYSPSSGGNLLDLFRAEWNANQGGIEYDLAHLMTAKPGGLIEFGGLAWVGVVCTSSAYGWSLDSAGIIGHEVGHNWAAPHCLDPSPCNNMCGACLNVGPVTKGVIEAHRDSRNCLETLPTYGTPLPPYFNPEVAAVPKNDFDTAPPVLIDVLANDEDGNCDPISIVGFDPVSARGGTVSRSVGTGERGRDEVRYELPPTRFLGTDSFDVTIGDDNGQTTTGTVTVEVRPLTIAGWWKLDELGGSTAADEGGAFDGLYQGNPTRGEPGATASLGTAAYFDGVGDRIRINDLDLNTNRITITAWVRRDGPQNPFAGIVFNHSGTTHSGLSFGESNELRYTWNGAATTSAWDSGLTVPDGSWAFVALVVKPYRATLYLGDGTTLSSATNIHRHVREAFDDRTFIARDIGGGGYMTGHVDDVRIYPWAMTADEIAGMQKGGHAEFPQPADGASSGLASTPLSWTAAQGADSHDVYLGTDYDDVVAATTASPEYQGNQPGTLFAPFAPIEGTTYFWRVDEVFGAEVARGRVWQYTVASLAHWELNETSGTTSFATAGGINGTYIGGAALNQPSANPSLGTAVDFDGVNDRVNIPALNLNTNSVTMTAWVRRQGAQVSFAGIVFSRAGSTAAGLNFGGANELRYHWKNDGSTWGWDSGLVLPDDTWVFVALVVEPDRATLYLGDGGVLTSAVNTVNHVLEEFDGQLRIGQDSLGGRYFGGLIDDVRIYNGALSAAEIGELYP